MSVKELLKCSAGIRCVYLYTFNPHSTLPRYERTVYRGVLVPLLYLNNARVEHFQPTGHGKITIYCKFDNPKDYDIY